MNRTRLLLVVSLLWFASVAQAAEPPPLRLPLTEADIPKLLRTDYYGAYLLGQKTGWAKISVEHRDGPDGGSYVSSLEMNMKLLAAGVKTEMKSLESEEFDAKPPYAFRAALTRETQRDAVKEIRLARTDKGFDVTIRAGGEDVRKQIGPLDYTLADSETTYLWVRNRPKRGDSITVRTVDMDELKIHPEVYKFQDTKESVVNGVKVTYDELLFSVPKDGISGLVRCDQNGERVLSMTVGGMFELRLEPEAVAKKTEFSGDLFELGKVKVDKKLGNESTITSLVLEAVGNQELRLKSGPRQMVETNLAGTCVLKLGKPHGQVTKPTAQELTDSLAETVDYPVSHAKIQVLAKEAIGDAKTPAEKVERLVHFVSGYIMPSYTAEPMTVMDLLKVRKGDCKHYARLLTTLARAVGVPARDVSGLVYAGDRERAFGLHAWNEVVLDGCWLPVDASADETEANPTHINFGTLGDDQMANIYAAFRKLRFRLVEVKH